MTEIRKTRLLSTIFAGAAFAAALTTAAVAAEPAPAPARVNTAEAMNVGGARLEKLLSANETVLADVPVTGRRTRATDEVLRLSTTRASSCAFDPSGFGTSGLGRYYGYGFGRSAFASFEGGYFSSTSPYGDASTGFYRGFGSVFGRGVTADGCLASDYSMAAGRAHIARNDKTMAAGYAAYEAGDFATAQTMFEKADRKLGGAAPALMLGRVLIERAGNPADVPLALKYLKYASGAPYLPRPIAPPIRPEYMTDDAYESVSTRGEAAAIMGKIHFVGYGVEANSQEALKWFKIALQQGHVPAGKIVGDIYYNGYGVERNMKEAERFYRAAAERGFAPAQVALGDLYYYGEAGAAPDVKEALGWYSQAARTKDAGALYALAHAYDAGEGVPRDAEKALGYYKLAALQGHAGARGAIGDYFYRGEIVERNPQIAREWFATAAAGGETDALFNLAAMMAKGEGGEADKPRAWALMKLADAKGHPTADQGIAALERSMSASERQTAETLLKPTAQN